LLLSSDYTDNSVTNGTTYYYVVTAVDTSSNESGHSNEASATPSEPITGITIQENETGFCGVDGIIEDEHSGYTGDGYANTDNDPCTGVDWRINILTGGTYTFKWRHALGASDRSARLLVDSSQEVSSINFPSTGAWTSWSDAVSVEITLSIGIKDIRLEATNDEGLPNIDYVEITGPNLQVASCQ
jgi:fibronectin type 3 domain-containing protein